MRASKLRSPMLVHVSLAVMASTIGSPARAQAEAPASRVAEGEQEAGLSDIVVTAQRREENLQRAALPISAVSGDDLVNTGVSDVTNISKLVPALIVQQSIGSSTNFYLRGVGSFAANAFGENSIAFSFNGVYVGRASAPLGTFYDLERVEVLKGPQGTLYGRNATGGAINVIPVRPRLGAVKGTVTTEYGNFDSKKVLGAINVPIGSTVAIRLAGQAIDRRGFLSDGYDDERGAAGRISVLFEPSSSFSALLVADYAKLDARGTGSVLVPGALTPTAPPVAERIGGADPRSLAELRQRFALVANGLAVGPFGDGYVKGEFWGVSLTVDADLGFADLTVIPAYRRSKPNYLSYNNGYFAQNTETDEQMSVEARLASNSEQAFRYVVGGFFFTEKQRANNLFSQGLISRTNFIANISNESSAIFGQATYDVTDRFRVVGGLRYTRENKTQNTLLRQFTPANPNPAFLPISGDLKFDSLTYKGGLEFDAGPQSLLYATVSTGFKSGGFFVGVGDNSFDPEKLTAYTVGAKNRFFGNKLQLNLEGFYWKFRDQQVFYVGPVQTSPGVFGAGGITANAGNSRILGAEVELTYQVVRNGVFAANLQYLDGKYTDFSYLALSASGAPPRNTCVITPNTSLPINPPARLFDVNCSGKPMVNAPKFSLNLSYEQGVDLGNGYRLVALARTRIESSRFLSTEYLPEQRQGNYMTSDIVLTLEAPDRRWALSAFVNNVEDTTLYAGGAIRPFLNAVYNTLRPPRTYGLRATVNFR